MPPPDACTLSFPTTSSSMLTFRLHPPVIAEFLLITSTSVPSYGLMFGKQVGRTVEIHEVFVLNLPFDSDSGSLKPNLWKEKLKNYKVASPNYKVLGCYFTGSDVQDSHMHIRNLMEATGGEFYILLNPASNLSKNELDMTIYEAVSRTDNGKSEHIFVKSMCTVKTVSLEGTSIHCGAGGADLEKLEGTCCENPWTYRRMLLETASGFAMLDVAERLLLYPEEIWTWFILPKDAHDVVICLDFIKVQDKSVVWESDIGPGKDLKNLIKKYHCPKALVVSDLKLKFVIEKNLAIACWFNERTVDELKWGINHMLQEFLPEEDCVARTMSKQLEKKIKEHGFNVPLHIIDREFISNFGHLYHLKIYSEAYSEILREKFCHIYYGVETCDHKFAANVAAGLHSKEIKPTDQDYSTEELLKFASFVSAAPAKIKDAKVKLERMVMVGTEKSWLDSELPQLQKSGIKLSDVVGLLRRYPQIAILCGCGAITLIRKMLLSLRDQ